MSKKIARSIGKSIEADEEKISVISYGLVAIIQFMTIFILSCTIALVFGFFIEALIIFISVGLLRRVIGGAHSASLNSCVIISVVFIDLFSYISRFIIIPYVSMIYIYMGMMAIYIGSYILVYKFAPVDNPNKPIKNTEKIKRLRKKALIVLLLFTVITIFLALLQMIYGGYYISYAISLSLSVLWQVIMLTKIGHSFIKAIDKLLGVYQT
ncbi:accessory gene regulator B family protein [Sedimentibacter sp. zth1]|uniref:accessory gene regulator ArgB-like protein n=1 Tax=Sedimentibacter sp. zth1 TaxID=2816908 RepID=UPI001A933496|nr:accessory gene regulator B family protein [Sedimentibacter sp. zth1]QSX07062.1 accessory gene regulator B family protein [Sedimentibacter sp. zth1]